MTANPESSAAEPRYPYVHVEAPLDTSEELSSLLFELGAQGVEERDASTLDKPRSGGVLLVASFASEDDAREAIDALAELDPPLRGELVFVVGDAWRDAWRAYFKPTRIGRRLVVRPSWEPFDATADDVVLTLDPGRAFGTGTHETTRLVLTEIDARVRGGETVLDVGAGTGILAVAALLVGASHARCVDNDADTVAVVVETAERNGVEARVTADATPVESLDERYDLVLANIEARVLIPLAAAIAARVAPGGTLVLSGLLVGQEDDVIAAYPGLMCEARPTLGEWAALVLRAPHAA
jgi:ribosomal protein L11 methyltransferase